MHCTKVLVHILIVIPYLHVAQTLNLQCSAEISYSQNFCCIQEYEDFKNVTKISEEDQVRNTKNDGINNKTLNLQTTQLDVKKRFHVYPNLPRRHHSNVNNNRRSIFTGRHLRNQPLVTVLLWTKYHNAEPLTAVADWDHKLSPAILQCPVRCHFTTDRNSLHHANGVVFHSLNVQRNELPKSHLPHQMWIFLEDEPPKKSRWDLSEIPNVFNWTMTYRRDSDIYHPYGQVIRRHHNAPLKPISEDFLLNKSGLIAWTASNCITSSKREQLVMELRKFIKVDVFGRCGSQQQNKEQATCIKAWPDGCFEQIEKKYKFYLALENSLCIQYVSEKFFNALSHNIVPVVYGYENYERIAPPNSFIDASKFNSIKELAKYLVYLDKTPSEYVKYFEWKKHYEVVTKGVGWCNLCKKLKRRKTGESGREVKWYRNIWKWWTAYNGTDDNLINSKDCFAGKYDGGKYHDNNENANLLCKACLEPPDFF